MPLWTPSEIITRAWYDLSDEPTVTLVSGAISALADKSGNGYTLSQTTAANRPAYSATINSLQVATFDGVNDKLSASVPLIPTTHSLFIVLLPTIETAVGSLLGQWASGQSGRFMLACNQDCQGATTGGKLNPFNSTATSGACTGGGAGMMLNCSITNSATLIESMSTTGAESWSIYKNGTVNDTATITAVYQGVSSALGDVSASQSLYPYDGQVAEVIIIASVVSSGMRQKIEGYLAHKWGFTASLPASHPYYASPPESDITYTSVMAYLDQVWGDPTLAASLIDQPWGIKIGADLAQAWSDAPVIRSMLSQPWGNAQPIRSQLVQRWQDMIALRAQLNQPWAIMESLLVTLSQPWAITSGPVQALLDQGWSIQDIEPVMAMLHQPWAIAADGSVLRYQVEVLADGQLVRTSHVNIEGGLDGDVLTCEIHPETEAEYLLCPYGAELVVTVTSQEGTDTFSFVVIEPRIAEEHGKTEYVVVAMSQAVLLGEPYADGQGGELSGLASEIAAVLAAPVPVSWETVDWTIPAGVWIASGETPLALLKTLAAAVGAVVQADPDGTLAIRPKYRIPLPNLDQATVDLELTEILDCFSTGDTPDHRSGYNRYLVGNQSASSDTGLTLEQTEISAKVKEVRGYQVPWAGDFELTHTGGPWVVIEPMGIEEREETETVEFVAGAGKTKFPIHGLVAMEWQRVNLGTVTTAEDGGLAADSAGQSLLTITYTTRCKLWRVHDLKSEQLQLVAEL